MYIQGKVYRPLRDLKHFVICGLRGYKRDRATKYNGSWKSIQVTVCSRCNKILEERKKIKDAI